MVYRGCDTHLCLFCCCTLVRFVLGFLGTAALFLRVPTLWCHYCASLINVRFQTLEIDDS